jgi:dolichol-phosphate mannosyltransferase
LSPFYFMKKVLVIIPTYNEAENIRRIIDAVIDVQKDIKNYKINILVVDDKSPDGTGDIVSEIIKSNDDIRMITGQKSGLGKAYLRGFAYGIDTAEYEAFIMMDADFSHDPKSIPVLLRTLDSGKDYVIGSRYVNGGSIPGNWPLMRIVNSRFANFIARNLIVIDKSITDLTGGFKAIKVSALEQIDLDNFRTAGYFFQVNLLHSFIEKQFLIGEAPIIFADRQFGESKLKVKDIIEFIYRAYMLNPQSQIRNFVRFSLVGLSGVIVNFSTLSVLLHFTQLPVIAADSFAIEISILTNFMFNNIYTFKALSGITESVPATLVRLLKFNVATLGGALISIIIFSILSVGIHWNYFLSDAIGIIVAMAWNYWISTQIIWISAHATA